MLDMPRPRPPHLHRERTRHGTLVWYVRVGKGPRMRLKAEYGSVEFEAAYRAALAGVPPCTGRVPVAPAGTLGWLIARYRETKAWSDLSIGTKRQRENIFLHVVDKSGHAAFADISRRVIMDSMDARKDTPFAAANFLKTMRGMFRWAANAELVENDPTSGVDSTTPRTDGFPVWTDVELAAFEARWPIGTRERLAFDILVYTGLRRGDAARLGRQHVREGVIAVRTAKNGELVTLPLLPVLAETIAATKIGDLAFVATHDGRPMTNESFGNFFRDACRAAEIRKSAHGLRKAAATRAADNGATESQLEAIFGWRGGRMASLYTRAANRKRLAGDAIATLVRVPSKITK